MFYGAAVWDPWLIVAQICCIQCLYYLSLGGMLWIFVGSQLPRLSLKYFFDSSLLSVANITITGWGIIAAFFLNALFGAGYLVLLVERTKKCLDFTATVYIIHLFFCMGYSGFPVSLLWWLLNGLCLAVMALLGEWLCMRRELRDIPVRSRSNV